MKRTLGLIVAILVFGLSVPANAILIDRGGGMIYDEYLDITWLQDTNYAMTSGYDSDGRMSWGDANTWAADLVYWGYDDWRLPTALNQNGSGPCFGYNCTDSELGYLYYIDLGNKADNTSLYGPLTSIGPFTNFPYDPFTPLLFADARLFSYWTSTPSSSDSTKAWEFPFMAGYQYPDTRLNTYYAWAVRDGDVAQVPEPSADVPEPITILLVGFGIAGMVGVRRYINS